MTKSDDGSFASRWSRRKRETQVREPAEPPAPADSNEAPARAGDITSSGPESDQAELEAPDVPDPDTLDVEADFTVFLQDGVPEALRRRALRRLWRLNPVFANLDGLNDYDDDYTDAATVVEGLKTLYKVGKGFITEEDEKEAEEKLEKELASDSKAEPEAALDEADQELSEIAPDSSSREAQGPDRLAVPDVIKQIEVSGPGNRRRGALARRWGKADG